MSAFLRVKIQLETGQVTTLVALDAIKQVVPAEDGRTTQLWVNYGDVDTCVGALHSFEEMAAALEHLVIADMTAAKPKRGKRAA